MLEKEYESIHSEFEADFTKKIKTISPEGEGGSKMKRISYLIISFVILLTISACSSSESNPVDPGVQSSTGTISGTVTESGTGAAVAAATVTLQGSGASVATNASGEFSFPNLDPGSYSITCNKDGYQSSTTTVTVTAGNNAGADMELTRIEPNVYWNYETTSQSHTIGIQLSVNPTLNGSALSAGDEIGVFYTRDGDFYCAGSVTWTGSDPVALTAWGDDTLTENVKDGFEEGDSFTWKVRRNNISYDATVTFLSGDETFSVNGISVLQSLQAE